MIPDALKKTLVAKILLVLAKDFLDGYPDAYLATQRFLRRNHPARQAMVGPDTAIVIDGFPRCGNSFVCRAFDADARKPKLAHHLHRSSHVIAACRLGLPTLVLIREPREAIISAKALGIQGSRHRPPDRNFPLFLYTRWYVQFYERIAPYRASFVLADFDQVTQDVGKVIRRVNEKFGTDFEEFIHTGETQQAIFDRHPFHLSPSRERDSIKADIDWEYEAWSNRAWAARAEDLYCRLTDRRPHYSGAVRGRGSSPGSAVTPQGDRWKRAHPDATGIDDSEISGPVRATDQKVRE